MKTSWSCVRCRAELTDTRCARCGAEAPVVGGVQCFLPPAHAYFATCAQPPPPPAPLPDLSRVDGPIAERVRARAEAKAKTTALFETLDAPVRAWLASQPPPTTLSEHIVSFRGESREMWEYFHVDWSPAAAFQALAKQFVADALAHRRGDGTAVVLGAAAGGLVRELAPHFRRTVGVDLALRPLLLARRLLDGEGVTLHYPGAGYVGETLKGTRTANVELVAADASALPFAPGSVDVVTTQYFLDVTVDPEVVAREIHRALGPQGVWLNLGLPFRLPGDPLEAGARTEAEVKAFLVGQGFEVLHLESRRYTARELTRLDPHARGLDERVYAFTARAKGQPKASPVDDAFAQAFAGAPERAFALKLAPFPGREVHLVEGQAWSGGAPREVVELAMSVDVRDERTLFRVEVPVPLKALLGAVLEAGREGLTTQALHEQLAPAFEGQLDGVDFLAALRELKHLGLVSFVP